MAEEKLAALSAMPVTESVAAGVSDASFSVSAPLVTAADFTDQLQGASVEAALPVVASAVLFAALSVPFAAVPAAALADDWLSNATCTAGEATLTELTATVFFARSKSATSTAASFTDASGAPLGSSALKLARFAFPFQITSGVGPSLNSKFPAVVSVPCEML